MSKTDRKKILLVSRMFHPVNSPRSFRTTQLVKEFARQGHDVTLYTVKDRMHHPKFEREFGVTIKDLGNPVLPGIDLDINRNRLTHFFKRVARRGLLQLFMYPDIQLMYLVRRALQNERGYDLLITIAVPHPIHWGTAWAWKENSSIADVWVADCGDPFMGATLDTFGKLFYFKYLEKAFCRRCDYITVPIEEAKEGYYQEFREKIKVIPQGFDFNEVDINRSHSVKKEVPTFAYAGGLIPGGRDPGKFLEYITGLDEEFKFILYTKSAGLVKPYMEQAGGRIEIRDYIPRHELLQQLSRMDFLVNFENATSLQMPSKLIDYYLTGRPVLSVDGENIDRRAINQFLDGNYSSGYQYNDVDRYRIENVCRKFLELQGRSV